MKLKAILVLLTLASCATTNTPPEEPAHGGKVYGITIDASSRTQDKPGFIVLLEGETPPSLQEEEGLRQVERALWLDGFPKEPGTMEVRVKFARENPITGTAIFGSLTPYKHAVKLRAIAQDQVQWELEATGPGEDEDIRPLLPYLLAGAIGQYGKNTSGKIERSVPAVSPRAATIRGVPVEKKGLLQK
jgi:hypothetical protein